MTYKSFGQEVISDWLKFDSININGIRTISLFHINSNNEKTLVERNRYNLKGQIIENIVFVDFTDEPLDTVYKYLYFFAGDSITLLERRLINTYSNKITDQIIYTYSYVDNKVFTKTIYNISSQDLEKESYYYDSYGKLVRQIDEQILFYGDSSDYKANWIYEYDLNGYLIKKTYVQDSSYFAFTYSNDSHGNILSYNFEGTHNCGDDIDRYLILYNEKSLPILKEIWNAMGENWAYKYIYDENNKLLKVQILRKFLKHKRSKKYEGDEPPPPPPMYTNKDFKNRYQKDYEYHCYYDEYDRLARIVESQFTFKFSETYLFEYE